MKEHFLTKRVTLRKLVLRWAEVNRVNPSYAWGQLFGQISNVYHIDVYNYARSRHCRPLDVIEDEILDEALNLAKEYFR
jgi:uncharacterized membrane protein